MPDKLVVLENITHIYEGPNPVNALVNVSTSIEQGDFVSIQGVSGSGKSTLLNILGLLDRPTEGKYMLNGLDAMHISEKERTDLRCYYIGFVFQSFHLLATRSAVENVELPLYYRGISAKKRQELASNAIETVSLAHRSASFPATLSGGERQRVAIARALVGSPKLLLCDEPTGSLDQKSSDNILELLEELNHTGLTIIIVTHDSAVANRSKRHLYVVEGQLHE